jgi:hypothetical protein
MALMLAVIFACIVVGLVSPRLGRLQWLVVTLFGIAMTSLYYLFPGRLL